MINIDSLYEKLIESKTGDLIPLTKDGKTLESRYNPQNDAARYYSTLNINSDFCLVLGIQSGFLIREILENNPDIFLIAVENTRDDLELLKKSTVIKSLSVLPNCIFCSLNELENILLNFFKPVFFNKFMVIEQKNWIQENLKIKDEIETLITTTLNKISKDFSVQAHFGKLWVHNFFSNLQHLNQLNSQINIPLNKTALIIAAGPSLDQKIQEIQNNREKYYLIATDTAFEAFNKYNIKVDAVISIDAQYISSNHFINSISKDTLFIFDLCGNSSAVKKILNYSKNIIFYNSGHPLVNLVNKNNILFNLNSGSGTVTISAVDFAIKCGFENIQIFGADFAYLNNKTYMKGTYLDNLYSINSNKFSTTEETFSKLMFRIPLIRKTNNKMTTEVLESYEFSLIEYLNKLNVNFVKKDDIYYINQKSSLKTFVLNLNYKIFEYNSWISHYISKLKTKTNFSLYNLDSEDYSLLPLMSFLKNHDNNSIIGIDHLYKKAIDFIERYK